MTKQEAIEGYPNLESMSTVNLIMLQNEAHKVGDTDFKDAILTFMGPDKENE